MYGQARIAREAAMMSAVCSFIWIIARYISPKHSLDLWTVSWPGQQNCYWAWRPAAASAQHLVLTLGPGSALAQLAQLLGLIARAGPGGPRDGGQLDRTQPAGHHICSHRFAMQPHLQEGGSGGGLQKATSGARTDAGIGGATAGVANCTAGRRWRKKNWGSVKIA